ncbi:MAG TPA: S8 family serine peptidase [Actinomycetota bacterium]|nr:S8 family serine peptidase [Actinomycetota bacterium]
MSRKVLLTALVPALIAGVLGAPASGEVPGDPYASQQWGLTRIEADKAWALADGSGVTIAVVDSGVDLGHPDLADKIVSHPDADFVDGKGDTDGSQDEAGHGTHVAGIAAAVTNNGIGVAGVAPGASVLPVRVLDENEKGTTARVAAGVRYAADKGAQVINLSVSYDARGHVDSITGSMRPVHDAVSYALGKGAVVVASSGNDSLPVCAEPAAVSGVLCVGAVDRSDRPAYYTNFDSRRSKNYLVGPGGDQAITCANDILSTYLRGAAQSCSSVDGYDSIAGTSMAASFVSGVAALLSSKGLANDAIVACLLRETDDLGPPGRDPVYGFGRVNALKAVSGC